MPKRNPAIPVGAVTIASVAICIAACASTERRFPLRAPLSRDGDLQSTSLPCRLDPNKKDPRHVSCAPEEYTSPLIWDGVDNMVFRPLSESFAVEGNSEAANVNSVDEVPDSAWFTGRIGTRSMSIGELQLGACDASQILDPASAADGTWIIDKGKPNGSSPGFRVVIPGKGKYMLKSDDVPERPSAASVIGAAAYHAAGYYTSCEQIVYFKPSILKLTPGIRFSGNFGGEREFDQKALDGMLAAATKRGSLVRFQASAWLPGRLIGPFRYQGTRSDDPSDIIDHEDRRDLRGSRLLAAWIDHFDAREQNSMDSWIADRPANPDSSPGHVVHYFLDTSDCLGSEWLWDEISRRLGYSYIVDWGDMAADFVTLGIPVRTWDRVKRKPGREIFGYFDVENFVPDEWKNEYPNRAFSRMTEHDGAWMARILARFTPEMVVALARMAQFSNPANTAYLASVLQGRLDRILERYLTRLSPIADVRVVGDQLCGVDLAERRMLKPATAFLYVAHLAAGRDMDRRPAALPGRVLLEVQRGAGGEVCVSLPHRAGDSGPPDDAADRYVRVLVEDGVARGSLVAYLYDLGPSRGYRLAGLERPDR
jgi:hypothetical protein